MSFESAIKEIHGPYNTKYIDETDMKLILERINRITENVLKEKE